MSKINLTPLEIRDLVNRYKSELRKLEFRISKTRETIDELQGAIDHSFAPAPKVEIAEPKTVAVVKKAPATAAAPTAAPTPKVEATVAPTNGVKKTGTRGRPRKTVQPTPEKISRNAGGGYRLSEWDNFIINSLQENSRVLISAEILDMMKDRRNSAKIKIDDEQLKGKLNRSLHKLANKREILRKIEHKGKGFAYALSDWLVGNKLPEKYRG